MCIIAYKSAEQQFPSKKTLKRCFDNNDDGAGFMYNASGKVYIKKGFATFQEFWKTLRKVREEYGDNIPYVMHFRISTQAGNRPDCTHPFPLSSHMKDLRLLETTTDIGIAHNGIISLTSSGYSKTITYSDTMEFIDFVNGSHSSITFSDENGPTRFNVIESDGVKRGLGRSIREELLFSL